MFVLLKTRLDTMRISADPDAAAVKKALKEVGVSPAVCVNSHILSRSIDSRRGTPILQYSILAELRDDVSGVPELEAASPEILLAAAEPRLELPDSRLLHPIVVGTGPCGLFAALALAMAGTKPIVLDRGQAVDTRYADYQRFLQTRELDEASNLLIGEGGAGTFSDGKLYTGTKDPRAAFILKTFADAGAPQEIRYDKRPHIGSDKLRVSIAAIRQKIISLGGEFRFGCAVNGPWIENNVCKGVITADGERLEAPAVLIAPGLGGRDLVEMLEQQGVEYALKSFQIGCRIEHPQELIDDRQFNLRGRSRPQCLGAAEYHMVSRPGGNAANVSTFCMCPGGEVLNATAWKNQSVTNGMSDSARSGKFANGCLIMTLPPERFASSGEIREFLSLLEKRCFQMGGGDYTLPAQDAAAFVAGRGGLSKRECSCGIGVVPGRLDELVPGELQTALRAAIRHFDRLCRGFEKEGILIGLESCVSSPVRFIRQPENLMSSCKNLWLGGEGVGAAGGIMSAAVDGIRLAECMLKLNSDSF